MSSSSSNKQCTHCTCKSSPTCKGCVNICRVVEGELCDVCKKREDQLFPCAKGSHVKDRCHDNSCGTCVYHKMMEGM